MKTGIVAGIAAMVTGDCNVCCCIAQKLTLNELQSNTQSISRLLTPIMPVNDCCQDDAGARKEFYSRLLKRVSQCLPVSN
jgi:hypothetical protein